MILVVVSDAVVVLAVVVGVEVFSVVVEGFWVGVVVVIGVGVGLYSVVVIGFWVGVVVGVGFGVV